MKDALDYFGSTDPRMMPRHLFWGAFNIDYSSAVRGNPEKQNYTVCPRHWYIDAYFKCTRCRMEFTWTAGEQKVWFEDYFFWIGSSPRLCKKCMVNRRHLESLRSEYDLTVSAARRKEAIVQKRRIIEVVRELETALNRLPEKMIETKKLFQRQIQKAEQLGAGQPATRPVVEPEGGDKPQPEAEGRTR